MLGIRKQLWICQEQSGSDLGKLEDKRTLKCGTQKQKSRTAVRASAAIPKVCGYQSNRKPSCISLGLAFVSPVMVPTAFEVVNAPGVDIWRLTLGKSKLG